MAEVHVGVSGWRYPSWRGDFYPRGLPQRRELEHVANTMTSVELNGSFYSLQRPTTYARIVEQTPEGFSVAVKGGRYITHLKRLADVESALANFFASGVLLLGDRLGPVLWQLPARFAFDAERLEAFFALLPRTHAAMAELATRHDDKLTSDRTVIMPVAEGPVRHALEPRHASYGDPAALDLLRRHDVSLVTSDSPRTWPCFEEQTSDFRYVRLHGHTELYASGYASASLDRWADKLRGWQADGEDCYVYFDNDARGRAPHDAVALLDRLRSSG